MAKNNRRIFVMVLIAGLLGSLASLGFASFIYDDSKTESYWQALTFARVVSLFPSIIVADILFLLLTKITNKTSICLIPFILLPIFVEMGIDNYFKHGNLSTDLLSSTDYRYFRNTPAYPLICDIVDNNPITINDSLIIDLQEQNSGMTPLLFCIRNKKYGKANELLMLGANPNVVDYKSGISPLLELLIYNDTPTSLDASKMQLIINLLNKDADTNFIYENKTPLMHLCSQTSPSAELCMLLIKHGADVNYRQTQEDAYLHECYQENECALNAAIYHGHYEIAKILINCGADTLLYKDWMYTIFERRGVKSSNLMDCLGQY